VDRAIVCVLAATGLVLAHFHGESVVVSRSRPVQTNKSQSDSGCVSHVVHGHLISSSDQRTELLSLLDTGVVCPKGDFERLLNPEIVLDIQPTLAAVYTDSFECEAMIEQGGTEEGRIRRAQADRVVAGSA
jgi:hypothetical protein